MKLYVVIEALDWRHSFVWCSLDDGLHLCIAAVDLLLAVYLQFIGWIHYTLESKPGDYVRLMPLMYLRRTLLGNEELDHSHFIVLSSVVEGCLQLVVNEVLAEIITFKEYIGNVIVPLCSR